jgi:hypothetical protein
MMSSTASLRLVLSSCHAVLGQQRGTVLSDWPGTVAVTGEWSTALVLHYSSTIAACPHALQAWTALPAHTSCRLMMALALGALEMCARALGTCMPSCTGKPARHFLMLELHGPQGTVRHMAAREPTSAGRRGLEPEDTWQYQSPPQPGGEV